ncbi:P-II family nitrogen regulator [Halalkalibacter urbisdiaboli]|uniref:P-II family nitrogen regulator n=1 Tax=Halalkalibacter urbisdiaboli TaxID=1960589 RepID=UPI000B42DA26|nr:P-II family nitrogen regulator [Halalkalibacter urbisdiaboli]
MKKIEAIIRPQKLTETIKHLKEIGITGFTVSQVVGRGQEADGKGVYRGQNYKVTLHPKVKLEIVLSDHMVDLTIKSITNAAQTGENGDGKIYVYPIYEAYNIRNGEPDTTVDDLVMGKE